MRAPATLRVLRSPGAAIAALVLLGLSFHLPRLLDPFGLAEPNAMAFFGLFSKTWEDFGFWELRGVPLWRQRVFDPAQGAVPYLNHPPGIYWLSASMGSSEWALRIPGVAGGMLAAICLFLLLRPSLGHGAAWAAAAATLGLPALTLYSLVSFESVAVGCGLLLWWAERRTRQTAGRARAMWWGVLVAVSFVGPWMDWSFGMFCLGLVSLTASRSLATWARRLVVPGIVAVVAVASVLWWQAWALDGPRMPPDATAGAGGGFAGLVDTTILGRPSWSAFCSGARRLLPAVSGWPVLLAGVLGLPVLLRRAPALAIGLLIASTHFVIFASHAVDHPHFYCFAAVMLAASAGALGAGLARHRAVSVALMAVVVIGTWASSWRANAENQTTFFRDLGAELTAAAGDPPQHYVAHNFWPPYAYYIETPWVYLAPLTEVPYLAAAQEHSAFSYLWFRRVEQHGLGPHFVEDAALTAFLTQYPMRRLPELETSLCASGLDIAMDIHEVYLVEVPRVP